MPRRFQRELSIVVLTCMLVGTNTLFAQQASDPGECLRKWLDNVKKMDCSAYSVKRTADERSAEGRHRYEMDQTDWVRNSDGRYEFTTHRWADVSPAFAVSDPKKVYVIKIVNRPGLGDLQLLELDQRYSTRPGSTPRLGAEAVPIDQVDALRHLDGDLDGYEFGLESAPEYMLGHLANLIVRRDDSKGPHCIVIEDKNEFGHCQFWLDPTHGYNLAYFEVDAGAGDLSPGGLHPLRIPYSNLDATGIARQVMHEHVVGTEFGYTLVDGNWVCSKCSVENRVDFASQGQTRLTRGSWERSNISFHPDFGHAFNLIIPDQTPFFKENQGGINYVWRDGKVVAEADSAKVRGIDNAVRSAQATQPAPDQ